LLDLDPVLTQIARSLLLGREFCLDAASLAGISGGNLEKDCPITSETRKESGAEVTPSTILCGLLSDRHDDLAGPWTAGSNLVASSSLLGIKELNM
jgi:hypothetical protein